MSHSAALGGAERALLELLDALTQRGGRCDVILPWWGPLVRCLKVRPVRWCVIPYLWWMGKPHRPWERIGRTLAHLLALPLVTARIQRWGCEVVYTNTLTVCVGALAARLLGRPHVWSLHEFGDADHGLAFDLGRGIALRLVNRLSDTVICCSKAVACAFRPWLDHDDKLHVVPCAVCVVPSDGTPVRWQPPVEAAIRCLIVGNLQPGKGQLEALRAIAALHRRGLRASLLIVGRATDRGYARALTTCLHRQQLDRWVHWVGEVENAFLLMEDADVVLVCSRCEAFGRVTVEAMRAGKPVIGTRSGGTMELIREGDNGLLYTPGDPCQLADQIQSLCDCPALARRMGQHGKALAAAQWTTTRYGEQVLEVLHQMMRRRTRAQ